MDITIRKFESKDIPYKVKWINDPQNNQYLHYDLPLEIEKTETWFKKNKDNSSRYDAVIEVNNIPVGIIGLLNINEFKAEYYITIGDSTFKGKNIAKKASNLLLDYGFNYLGLRLIYLFTEVENIPMQKLAHKLGMFKEATLNDYLIRDGLYRHCYYYTINKDDFFNEIEFPKEIISDINYLEKDDSNNEFYMKRDDLISFSFGGNKTRKAKYFFKEILDGKYTTVVTYGSKSSNHCRVISNLCAKHSLNCVIVSPYSEEPSNYNRDLIQMGNAEIIECAVNSVSITIDKAIEKKTNLGEKVYFIPGGGHGNNGTQAYVDAYHEIVLWERKNKITFDYIFFASGTGTTQAGLIAGQLLHNDSDRKIVGISIARDKARGKQVILDSLKEYFNSINHELNFDYGRYIKLEDQYIAGGYGKSNEEIYDIIKSIYLRNGVPLNSTYTGKAYYGMKKYTKQKILSNKNILFVNTGGSPLFFNDLENINSKG